MSSTQNQTPRSTGGIPRSGGVEGCYLVGGEGQVDRGVRVADGFGAAGAWDGDDDWGLGEHPGEGEFLRANAQLRGQGVEGGVLGAEVRGAGDAAERGPGEEGDAEFVAEGEFGLAGAEG